MTVSVERMHIVVVISVALFHTVHLTTNFTIPANEKGLQSVQFVKFDMNVLEK